MTLKKFIVWFGIIGSVASIVSLLYIFIPSYKSLEINVRTISLENLTDNNYKLEPELKIIYRYKGEEVNNLWKYIIRITNSSNKTLIGIGNQKNILTDMLTLNVAKGYELLDKKLLNSDFTHNLAIIDSSKISLTFQQWRPDESIEYAFYIKVKKSLPTKTPFLTSDFRQVIDGDFIFTEDDQKENKRITQVVPKDGLKAAYFINFIILGSFILIITIVILGAPFSYNKTAGWYKRHYSSFSAFVKETFKDDEKTQKKYLENPRWLPNALWKKFSGDKYPETTMDFDFKKFYQLVLLETILTLINISILIVFIDLIYAFPANCM